MMTYAERRELLTCHNVSDNLTDLYCPNCRANVKLKHGRKTKFSQCQGCKASLRVTRRDRLFILDNLGESCPVPPRQNTYVPTIEDLKAMGWV